MRKTEKEFCIDRHRRLLNYLETHEIDALLVTKIENVRYLSGFSGSSAYIIFYRNKPALVTDFRYKIQAEEEVCGFDIVIKKAAGIDAVGEVVKDLSGIKKLGFESRHLVFEDYIKLKESLDGVTLISLSNVVEEMRAIKDKGEIEKIRTAVKRAEGIYPVIKDVVAEGAEESEVSAMLEYEVRKSGCHRIPFEFIVASGFRGALPHAPSSRKKIKEGDTVVCDWGAEADGYFSDITRTLFIGDIEEKMHRIYNIVLYAQQETIKAIKPGISVSHLDLIARSIIIESGFGEYFGHGTGHGVGLSVHELPIIRQSTEDRIQSGVMGQKETLNGSTELTEVSQLSTLIEGMVFTVEPGIYVPGLGGVRIEDMVVVTENGCEVLTSLPK